jgi:hypothetical protein
MQVVFNAAARLVEYVPAAHSKQVLDVIAATVVE